MPTERVGSEALRDQGRQPIEALAQVRGLGGDVHAHRRRQRQHGVSSAASARTRSSVAGSKPGRTCTTRPLGSAISIGSGATADASVTTWTGRKRGASVNDDGEGCEGRSARSFQRHQYSCLMRWAQLAKPAGQGDRMLDVDLAARHHDALDQEPDDMLPVREVQLVQPDA